MKKAILLMTLLLSAGIIMAIQPASSWTVVATGKYNQSVVANVTTEGGNVTNVNLGGNVSTERWAGFWGNVTGEIILSPSTSIFYRWAWSSARGGEVCAVASPVPFDWTNVQAAVANDVDSVWGFGDATDNATNTLTQAVCNVYVAGTSVTTVGNLTGVGGFETCAVADNGAPAAKSDLAFCTNISQGGSLFNGQDGDYEVLVPTDEADGATETYYFWIELD
ncbi:MAG: hypothetical protein ABII71_00335 [Candidatus Micrarchaeota archaeon]